jgi:flagellar basal-body rod modification protein FlgD
MTTVNTTSATGAVAPASQAGFSALGHGDFLRLLVEQLKQQDPFDPVDNKEMLAQMAQFSALSGTTEGNATLQAISDKLDQLIAAQAAAPGAAPAN